MIKVASHILIKRFYEQNSGMLLFIFFIMFGMVESTQVLYYHLSLIYGVVHSPIFLSMVTVVWLLYSVKTIHFYSAQLAKVEHEILFELARLTGIKIFRISLMVTTIIDLPVLLYASVIVGVAIYSNQIASAAIVLIIQVIRVGVVAWMLTRQLQGSLNTVSWKMPEFRFRWALPPSLFYVSFLQHQHKVTAVVTKLFSLVCIIGMLQVDVGHYEPRLILLGLTAGVAAHAVIIFEFRRMEDQYLGFIRALPIRTITRFAILLSAYGLLLLPELVLGVVNHIQLLDMVILIIFGLGTLLFLHISLYDTLNMDKHIKRTSILFLLSFLVVLSAMAWLAALVLLALAYWRLWRNYHRYEVEAVDAVN